MVVGCHPYAPAAFTPKKCSWYSFLLEAESTPGPWCDRKDFMLMKNPMTPAGIEPATFRFVAQHLNHWATVVPSTYIDVVFISYPATKWLCLAEKCRVPQKLDNFQSNVGTTKRPQSIGREKEMCLKANPKGHAKFITGRVTYVPYNNNNNNTKVNQKVKAIF